MKDMSFGQSQVFFQVHGAHRTQAGFVVGIHGQTVLYRFGQMLIDGIKIPLGDEVSLLFRLTREETVGHVQSEECQGVVTAVLKGRR